MLHPVSFMCLSRHTNNSSKLLRKKVTHELKVRWIFPYISINHNTLNYEDIEANLEFYIEFFIILKC